MFSPLELESAPAATAKRPTRRAVRLSVFAGVAVASLVTTAGIAVAAPAATAPTAAIAAVDASHDDFGPNVKIFDPSMPLAEIQATVNAVATQQVNDEMGPGRYALLFKPGTYGTAEHPLQFQVGYYTEVAGLGKSPEDVVINGKVEVFNRCLEGNGTSNCLALVNFWRSVSNLTISVNGRGQDGYDATGQPNGGCVGSANFYAVSQAAPMRRVNVINGNVSFMDYCSAGPQYASGGFLADSKTGFIVNGSQQQWLTRNSTIGGWSNGIWNQVFAGVVGAPAQDFNSTETGATVSESDKTIVVDAAGAPLRGGRYTVLPKNPLSREKPFMYVDPQGTWKVLVPSPRRNAAGTSWENGDTAGRVIPLSQFYVAKPGDSEAVINAQLARGKNLLFTPGIYQIKQSILVGRANTIVLGLGLPTLESVNGVVPLKVANVEGVGVSGLMLEAGAVNSPSLLQVGERVTHASGTSSAANPTALQDVFFRVGGRVVGNTSAALVVNSDNVLMDDVWIWRADHGRTGIDPATGQAYPVTWGWDVSKSANGLIVNGNNVTATGLFVEHFQEYNVIWNGENGKTIFFQNELPYDAPNQAAWQHDGVLGWAAYKVADSVKTHELWGGGSYIYTNVDPTLHATRAFEVPVTAGVKLHDLLTVQLNAGTIDHVVNNTGTAVSVNVPHTVGAPSMVTEFPVPVATPTP